MNRTRTSGLSVALLALLVALAGVTVLEKIAIAQGLKDGIAIYAYRMLALVNVAICDATVAAWDAKYAYNRPRPSEADPSLTTVVLNPRSPSSRLLCRIVFPKTCPSNEVSCEHQNKGNDQGKGLLEDIECRTAFFKMMRLNVQYCGCNCSR